ncbi:hypothetical protein M6D93_01650 [Jatrophihabitans telluris]|uniref:Uncharacterized protein n=1 Tax=Jatrophihabitans telluris TaxID=2038343 RepID=A0ABY4R0Z3_9ACTN|nr:hypothetical protein [Jatrophihabitans telluris]UQX88719.1 hypothetical protein M6D93_01650 [Jatrophihabitans telluris]
MAVRAEPTAFSRIWPLLCATILSGLVGFASVRIGARHTVASVRYVSTPQFGVWTCTIILAWALIPGVLVLSWSSARALAAEHAPPLIPIVVCAGAAIAVADLIALAGYFMSRPATPTGYYLGLPRLLLMFSFAAASLAPGVFAVLRAHRLMRAAHLHRTRPVAERVLELSQLRSALRIALIGGALLVSVGVLATGTQRQAVLAAHPRSADFPAVTVVVWGIAASLVLALLHGPGYLRLGALTRELVDDVLPIQFPDWPTAVREEGRPALTEQSGHANWRGRMEDRAAFAELVRGSSGGRNVGAAGLSLAGPVITAGLALLIGLSG